MGTFTSKYKVTDGNGVSSTQTRVDAGKSIDAGVSGILIFMAATIGIWVSGFLWFIFQTVKEPTNISYKDMQKYGIDTQPILDAKKKAWIFMIITLPVAPLTGWLYYSSVKSKLQIQFSVAKEFNDNFINAYYYAIDEKKQIINNALSTHSRDSEEYKNIAQQELNDLVTSIQDEFFYNTPIMKIIETKSKGLLSIDFPISSVLDIKGDEEKNICSADNLLVTNKYFTTHYYKLPIDSIEDVSVNQKKRSKLKVILGVILILIGLIFLFMFSIDFKEYYKMLEYGFTNGLDKNIFMMKITGSISIIFLLVGLLFILIRPKERTLAIRIKNKIIDAIADDNKLAIKGFYDGIQKAKSL